MTSVRSCFSLVVINYGKAFTMWDTIIMIVASAGLIGWQIDTARKNRARRACMKRHPVNYRREIQ